MSAVGVVVAAHGWAPYLAEALDCVLAEDPAEVVVVDDGSPAPLELHPDHAARCRLLRREVRGGPGAARNDGVAELTARVDLLAFCDADDAWTAGSLAPRVAALDAEPALAGVFGTALVIGPDDRPTGERWPAPAEPLLHGPEQIYAHNPILTSSVVLRRESFGRFDACYPSAEDWELWLRLLADGGVLRHVPEAVVRYRRHPGGLTSDVLGLARAQRRLHEAYGGHVSAEARAAAARADAEGEAAGLLRAGRFADARRRRSPGPRRALLAVPGLRGLAGRRDPYR